MCCWLKCRCKQGEAIPPQTGRYYRALRPTKPCSGSCRKRRLCKPFMAMWSGWRERATNNLQPCCTYRGFTALSRRFVKSTRSVFGPAAGFDSKELQVGNGIWRVDMMKCPYHDTCVAYGCPELCCCFATATTSATPVFIRSSFGIEQKRWGAAMTAATLHEDHEINAQE